MSTGVVEENVTGRSGEEASPPISPSMEDVLPIRGVDADTGEVVAIPIASLREAEDPYRANVVRWAALDVPSIMVAEDMRLLRDAYRIPSDIGLLFPDPNERACFSRMGCTSLNLNAFVSGMRLSLHPFFRKVLPAYGLAPIQTIYQPRKLPKKKGKDEKPGWVDNDPEPNLDVPSIYGIANALPRCELSIEIVEVLQFIYQAPPATRRYGFILNRHCCLIELGLMTMDKKKCPRPVLARLNKQKLRALVAGSSEEARQKKVLEDLSREENREAVEALKVIEVDDSNAPEGDVPQLRKMKLRASGTGAPQENVEIVDNYATCSASPLQRTLAVNTSGEVVLEGPPKLSQKLGGTKGGPYESKRRLRELIGAPGARIPDDVLWNVPFYPSMGAQTVKKYFTPKWEEFSSHGELEDVLETSLTSGIRASTMQLKVLGEFRTRMQEQRELSAAASKSDKEHRQALEGLQAALDSAHVAYEQMEADLKESDSNILNLTK
ncbi:hypothetical protein Adt_46715 [Abeliophyllum distichum]|uniref:Uncharacterized protein n=1 Tax=Abeliophyllum distichum TaxID=126358 RepID=A0ABD1NYG3_9LAMI